MDFNADDSSESNTGHFILALDISRFIDPAVFAAAVVAHLDELRGSDRLPDVDAIRLPGEEGAGRGGRGAGRPGGGAARSRDGIPLSPALAAVLDRLGAKLGIGPP